MFNLQALFGSNLGKQAAAPAEAQAAQAAPAPTLLPQLEGHSPKQETSPAVGTGTSPLDQFTKFWETAPEASGTGAPQGFQIAPDQIKQQAQSLDFSKLMTPDIATAIVSGGEGAAKAVSSLINQLGQAVFAASSMNAAGYANNASKQYFEGIDSRVQDQVRGTLASNNVLTKNPQINHPAVKPVYDAMFKQARSQYPNASSNELETHVVNLMKGMSQAFGSPQDTNNLGPKNSSKSEGLTDFSNFLD
jgi:hypothetical protein